MANGEIHLGKKPSKIDTGPKTASEPKESFPTMHVHDVAELDNLPSGHFHFIGKGKVVHKSKSERDGKKTSSHEIEVHSMKPIKGGSSKGGLEHAMNKIAKQKEGGKDDEEDKNDGGVDEYAEGESS